MTISPEFKSRFSDRQFHQKPEIEGWCSLSENHRFIIKQRRYSHVAKNGNTATGRLLGVSMRKQSAILSRAGREACGKSVKSGVARKDYDNKKTKRNVKYRDYNRACRIFHRCALSIGDEIMTSQKSLQGDWLGGVDTLLTAYRYNFRYIGFRTDYAKWKLFQNCLTETLQTYFDTQTVALSD